MPSEPWIWFLSEPFNVDNDVTLLRGTLVRVFEILVDMLIVMPIMAAPFRVHLRTRVQN